MRGTTPARPARLSQRAASLLLLAPTTLLYLSVYLGGLVMVVAMSIDVSPGADGGGPTFAHYRDVFGSAPIGVIVLRTLRDSVATVIGCMLLGIPVARYITASTSRWKGLVLMAVLSPLMVSAIGRIFGWIALFGPGSVIANGLNAMFGGKPTGLLYTEAAIIIGLTNLLLPFMVLSVATSRAHFEEDMAKAARSLGATPMAVLWQVELPLIFPGILSGALIVFSLSTTNFVTAALLGGSGRDLVGYEIYLDILVYFQQGRGAALAILLLVVVVALMMLAIQVAGQRRDDRDVRTGAGGT
jgi:putative spermidine/putrescine transport system permease protein